MSLPQRLSPQTGLYDPHPTSLLEALRQHGHPKHTLSQPDQQQPQQQHQQLLLQMPPAAALHRQIERLQHELPERQASDGSPSGMMSPSHGVAILLCWYCTA